MRSSPHVTISIQKKSALTGYIPLIVAGIVGYYIGYEKPKDPIATYQDIRLIVNRAKDRCMTSGEIGEDALADEKQRIALGIKNLNMTCTTSETPTENICDRVFTVLNGSTEIENDSEEVPCSDNP